MKNTAQILNLLLATALVIVTLTLSIELNKNPKEPQSTSSALDVIMTRSSIRSYTNKTVEEDKIDLILRAAMAAPTAGNKQPWSFVVVRNKETLTQLAKSSPYTKMVPSAPLAIVVCGDLSKGFTGIASGYWVQDASAATQNLLLAAHSLGLGAVWTGLYPLTNRSDFVRQVLSLPSHMVPLNIVPIGYPADAPNIKDKYKPENIIWEKFD